MKCMCHSLALCIQKGFDKLPSSLGFLLKEIPKWFSKSTLRRDTYKDLFKVMSGSDNESSAVSTPFTKISTTRWLVRGKVLYDILTNWEELKAYFTCASQSGGQDVRYKARMIADMLHDDVNRFYFIFASPVVSEFEQVNAMFQATDPEKLVRDLYLHESSLRRRVYRENTPRSLSEIEFGAKFDMEVANFLKLHPSQSDRAEQVKVRCKDMLTELVHQVEQRLPQSKDLFKGLSALSPNKVLSQMFRLPFKELPRQELMGQLVEDIESQYRKICCHIWAEEEGVFDGDIPNDTMTFWSGILR